MAEKKEMTLEASMARLEEITSTLEKEKLPLKDMMKLYKEGKQLEKQCMELLNKAEEEVRILEADEEQ